MSTRHSTKSDDNIFTKRREPFGMMLWLCVIGSTLTFISIFLIYWFRFDHESHQFIVLPDVFWLSTLVVLFSSITLHEANLAFKQERFNHYRVFIGATFSLGVTFMVLQLIGWYSISLTWALVKYNNAFGFIYLLICLHLFHIIIGVVYMGLLFKKSVENHSYVDSFVYSVNAPNRLKIKLITRYWHFVDILWLMVFLLLTIMYH